MENQPDKTARSVSIFFCCIKYMLFEKYSIKIDFYNKGSDSVMMHKKLMKSKTIGMAAGIIGLGAAAAMLMKRSRRM